MVFFPVVVAHTEAGVTEARVRAVEAGPGGPAKVSSYAADGVEAGGVGGTTAGEEVMPFLRERPALFRGAAGLSLQNTRTQ